MDVKYINPFLEAVVSVLGNFGISDVKRSSIQKKETMHVDLDITSVIGLVGRVRGNIAYSLSEATALGIVSKMMNIPVKVFDDISRSAIGELANMITGTASGVIAGLTAQKGLIESTAPSIIMGKDIYFMISSVPAIAVTMDTPAGRIEVNIGLEA